jgi:hypothetical protein
VGPDLLQIFYALLITYDQSNSLPRRLILAIKSYRRWTYTARYGHVISLLESNGVIQAPEYYRKPYRSLNANPFAIVANSTDPLLASRSISPSVCIR